MAKKKFTISKQKLESLYFDEDKSPRDIAEIYGCSYETVLNRINEYGIEKKRRNFDLTGEKNGKITAIEFCHINDKGDAIWKCSCECGNVLYLSSGRFRYSTMCCDCSNKSKRTHGESKTNLYKVWMGMKTRCYNPKSINYSNYGGRDIKICEEWKDDFERFCEDMECSYKKGLTIERVDNDGDYCSQNCVWATPKEQGLNKRNNVKLHIDGKERTITEWAEHFQVDRHKLYSLHSYHKDFSGIQLIEKAKRL